LSHPWCVTGVSRIVTKGLLKNFTRRLILLLDDKLAEKSRKLEANWFYRNPHPRKGRTAFIATAKTRAFVIFGGKQW
jgi:hypothetical protein